MKILTLIVRILLGAGFMVFGANGLHPFLHMPVPVSGTPVGDWTLIMMHSGYMQHIAACQFIGGALVLFGGTAPLGLCILGPILVNVLFFHVCLTGGHGIGLGLLFTALEIFLIYAYRANFAGIFTTKAKPQ